MIAHKTIQVDKETIADVTCDCCGKSCRFDMSPNNDEHSFEFMSINCTWGYFSGHDGERWSAQICEECATTKFNFVKFKKTNYIFGGEIND